MRRMRWASALLLALMMDRVALADDPPPGDATNFDREVARGVDLYGRGDYTAAIGAFHAAFAFKTDPKLLFNIARCQEKLGKIDDAIATYQQFVDSPGTTSQERAKALESMKALRDERDAREAIAASDKKRSDDSAARDAAPALTPKTEAPNRLVESAPRDEAPRRSHTLEWILIGSGSVALVTGGIFGGLALQNQSTFESSRVLQDKLDARDSGQRNAAISDVSIGVGAAAIVGGALVLLLMGDES